MSSINFSLENNFDQGLARTSDNELLKWTSLLEIPDFAEFFSVAKRFMRP